VRAGSPINSTRAITGGDAWINYRGVALGHNPVLYGRPRYYKSKLALAKAPEYRTFGWPERFVLIGPGPTEVPL
jgi:hypothetical protein